MEIGQDQYPHYESVIAAARKAGPVAVALAHPCDAYALEAALDATRLGLIEPILVGPGERIRSAPH